MGKIFKYLFILFIISTTELTVNSQEKTCLKYRQYPLPGHPVMIIDLHPTDKYYLFLKEFKNLRMILLEPGICEILSGKKWFKGRVFVFKSRSEGFSHGDIISIERGRFR